MTETGKYPEVYFYAGQNVDEMTIEELREAVKELGRMYNTALKSNIETHDLYRGMRGWK